MGVHFVQEAYIFWGCLEYGPVHSLFQSILMIRRGSQVMLRGWRETLLLFFVSANICFAKNNVERGGDVLDILSSVKGSFTQTLDDDLSLTVSYDLADDSRVPISFVTG